MRQDKCSSGHYGLAKALTQILLTHLVVGNLLEKLVLCFIEEASRFH